jgi:hypothetical protein
MVRQSLFSHYKPMSYYNDVNFNPSTGLEEAMGPTREPGQPAQQDQPAQPDQRELKDCKDGPAFKGQREILVQLDPLGQPVLKNCLVDRTDGHHRIARTARTNGQDTGDYQEQHYSTILET